MMRKATGVTCTLVLLLLAPGVFPASGADVSTLIVPGKSLGPVRLGMSAADITAVLGQPASRQGDQVRFPRWGVTVTLKHGVAARVSTTNPQFRTISGAGVGIRLDDATQLVGELTVAVTVSDGTTDVLYASQGIGFVFRDGRAVEAFVVGQVPPGQPLAPGSASRLPGGPRVVMALKGVSSAVDAATGVLRVSGEVVNTGFAAADRVTVAATFIKMSGDEIRRQVVIPQPVAAYSSAPFTLETLLLGTVPGSGLVASYSIEVKAGGEPVAGGDPPPLAQGTYTVPVDSYSQLARGQVHVDTQLGAPSNTSPRVQVLVSVSGNTGSIPPALIRDVLVEIPFTGLGRGSEQIHLRPGETVTILAPAVGTVIGAGLVGGVAPSLLGEPVVVSVTLGTP